VYASIANLSRIERFLGADAGQAAIASFTGSLQEHLRNTVAVGRFSSSQFCCLENCSYDDAIRQVHLMTKSLGNQTDLRETITPRFMTVMFNSTDGVDRLRKRFFDLQKQNP
jgi:GGDEF domain-containing protein